MSSLVPRQAVPRRNNLLMNGLGTRLGYILYYPTVIVMTTVVMTTVVMTTVVMTVVLCFRI